MITTTAIVLQLRPYSDRARMLRVYTRASGCATYIVYGVGSRKKGAGIYSPLSLVELSIREGRGGGLGTVEHASLIYTPQRIPTDIRRQTVAMFLSELLSHTLYQPMQDEPLFDYLMTVITDLDHCEDPENVHLRTMQGLAERLGFAIDEETYPRLTAVPSSRAERQEQLRQLCTYYADHVDGWQEMKSLDILTEIFD
ncbi:MAG: recombination protein O N-terminal domain-containing protein [Paludibacteraceae bacterium]|nr:recombination protein O N-terminal domain-containing protein [Paludibacteraceae bacterium]